MLFRDLELAEPILRAVTAEGYEQATPIQAGAIPAVLHGRDVLGCAQTGTGKTAAFALPMLHRLADPTHKPKPSGRRKPRLLVLSPTRELAQQIGESFKSYGKGLGITGTTVYGGVNQRWQVAALNRGIDVIIATPGRLMDLMNQGYVDLTGIEAVVLDEADRMLDMGFIHDIKKIVKATPNDRQTLLFSATMPTAIRKLADQFLTDPVSVHIAPEQPTADKVEQLVYHVNANMKPVLLAHLLENLPIERSIVFTRTKHGADRVVKQLRRVGVTSEAIHGNKSQNARTRTLDRFKGGKTHVLIATDVASRGIDVDGVSHVINYDLTNEPESYVHRIGRTARAGESGVAITFCVRDELSQLRAIERLLTAPINIAEDHPDYGDLGAPPQAPAPSDRGSGGSGQKRKQWGGGRRGGGKKPHRGQGSSNGRARSGGNTASKKRGSRGGPGKPGRGRGGGPRQER